MTVNRQNQLNKTGSSLTYNEILKLRQAREKEFTIQGIYKLGYRNKEDISNLPPNTLVVGSQNVLTNAAEQVTIRNGYTLDGPAGTQNNYGVSSSYDFNTQTNGIQNLRQWGTTLECRYENPVTKAISWVTLLNNLNLNACNFTDFWESTLATVPYPSNKTVCLFVNGGLNVYRWSGAVGSYLSSTANSITMSGTESVAQLNFDSSGSLLIDGTIYSYTSAGNVSGVAYTQNPTNATYPMYQGYFIEQKITTGPSATQITTVTLNVSLGSTGAPFPNPATVNGFIYTDTVGNPGTFVAEAVGTTSGNANGNYTITFTFNQNVAGNTNYHMVFTTNYSSLPFYVGGAGFVLGNVSAYIGATAGTGTQTGIAFTGTSFPTSWTASNGYLAMTVNENNVSTTVFNNVTPTPAGMTLGDAIIQNPTVLTSAVNGSTLPTYDLIANLNNQLFYGSFNSNIVYLTRQNLPSDCTQSAQRLQWEGSYAVLDTAPVAFKQQATDMYISSGESSWWKSTFATAAISTNNITYQTFNIYPLQTASKQATQSQALITHLKNSLVFVSNETIVNAFGPVKNIFGNPNFVNMSDPIKYDIDAYNFTGGQLYYYNYFLYMPLPAMGIERIYNVEKKYWEAPQTVPFSRHYEVNGVLYAHSSLTNESYQCYAPNVYRDNGNPINSVIAFPYVSSEGGASNQLKNFNKHYTEGYIAANTTLLLTINYDFGGYTGTYSTTITGTQANIIFNKVTDGSLGQNTLGSEPLGSILNIPNAPPIPKFRIINTFPRLDCFEYQIVLSTDDIDQNFALLRSGPAVEASDNLGVQITI